MQRYLWDTLSGCRWEDYNKVSHKELTCRNVNWIQLPQSRIPWCTVVENMVINLPFSKGRKCL
jgi:hypothetical protein